MSVQHSDSPHLFLAGPHLIALDRFIRVTQRYLGHHAIFDTKEFKELDHELRNAIRAFAMQEERKQREGKSGTQIESYTAAQAAELTGYSIRTVQYHAQKWGAQKVKGRWALPPSFISYLREDTRNE